MKMKLALELSIYAEGHPRAKQIYFWAKEYLLFWEQLAQHQPSAMTWAAVSSNYLIGPFFKESNVTAESYTIMRREQFIPGIKL